MYRVPRMLGRVFTTLLSSTVRSSCPRAHVARRCVQKSAVFSILIFAFSGNAQERPNAEAIIRRGITAHGGAKNLEKLKSSYTEAKGTIVLGDITAPFRLKLHQQLPNQSRAVSVIDMDGKETITVQTLNGEKAWNQLNGVTAEADAESVHQRQAALYACRVMTLTPLLSEKAFVVTNLGDTDVNGKTAICINVSCTGQKDSKLYFDTNSGLLLKSRSIIVDIATKKTVTQDEFYDDYQEFDGVKQPTRIAIFHDGKQFMDATVTRITFSATMDEQLFATPE